MSFLAEAFDDFFLAHYWTFTVRILWRFNNNLFGKEFFGWESLCFSDEKKEFNARKNFVVRVEDPLRGLTDFMGYRTKCSRLWVIGDDFFACWGKRSRQIWRTKNKIYFQLCQLLINFINKLGVISPNKNKDSKRRKQPREKRDKNFIYKQLAQKKTSKKENNKNELLLKEFELLLEFSFSSSLVAFGCGEKKQPQQQLSVNIINISLRS